MKARSIAAVIIASAAGLAMLFLGFSSRPEEPEKVFAAADVPPAWKPEVVEAVEQIPLSDSDGRLKSLYTFAYYELLRTRGYAGLSLKVEGADKKRSWTPTAWMLDCLFYPDKANNYPVFVVDDSEVLAQLGLTPHAKQRDRYSFNELLPAKEPLTAAAQRLSAVEDSSKLSRIENQTVALYQNFSAYEALISFLDAARAKVTIPADVSDETLKPAAGKPVSALQAAAMLMSGQTWVSLREKRKTGESVDLPDWFKTLATEVENHIKPIREFRWYGPSASGRDDWEGVMGMIRQLAEGGSHQDRAAARLTEIGEMVTLAGSADGNEELQKRMLAFANARVSEAKSVDAYGKVSADRAYLKWRVFEYVKWGFIVLFLVCAISWLRPPGSLLHRFVYWMAWAGFIGIGIGTGQRVWITGWGPVTNIFETIPYITMLAGVFALLMTKVMHNAIPVAVSIAVGASGMFLALSYEIGNSKDTIDALQAVLRSNYWLWTHVTTINIGYATVMLAAVFSMVYIFARMFDILRTDTKLCRDLTRASYGILCFGLFFSLIGTILGGIWANDSWGRFWGWDPKENGALLICFWCLLVMHLRVAGWIREFGFHLWTTLGAIPCIFSWWHVNQLQIGLHSYGFTQGLDTKLMTAYAIVGLVFLAGVVVRLLEVVARRQMEEMKAMAAGSGPAPLPEGRPDAA